MAYKTAAERIRWVVERINTAKELTDNNIIKLGYDRAAFVFGDDYTSQFRHVLKKLEREAHIKIIKVPYDEMPSPKREHPKLLEMFSGDIDDPEYFDPYFHIEVLQTFDNYYTNGFSPAQKLTAKSYNARTTELFINGQRITISSQKNKLGNPRTEPMQAHAMRLLFNDVNSLKNGVPLRKIVNSKGVIQDGLKPFQRKQAKNHIAAINKKLREVTGGRNLIKIDLYRFYVDPELIDNG